VSERATRPPSQEGRVTSQDLTLQHHTRR
jgi:hypothetical protein